MHNNNVATTLMISATDLNCAGFNDNLLGSCINEKGIANITFIMAAPATNPQAVMVPPCESSARFFEASNAINDPINNGVLEDSGK